MQKPSKKSPMILIGIVIALVIIFLNSTIFNFGSENGTKEGVNKEHIALEEALMMIEGVGEVSLYFHYNYEEKGSPLSDYFSLSSEKSENRADNLMGILVIAEGAKNPQIQNDLSKMLSAVLQLPEHRIVIVEMKKRGNMDENK